MRYFLIILSLLFVTNIAYASDYCVSGAGVAGVDGGYTFNNVRNTYDHDDGTDFRLVYTGYYELRSGANPYIIPATTDTGYYYDSHGSGGSFLGLDTLNSDGVYPIPTVVAGSCAATSTPMTDSQFQVVLLMICATILLLDFIRRVLANSNK